MEAEREARITAERYTDLAKRFVSNSAEIWKRKAQDPAGEKQQKEGETRRQLKAVADEYLAMIFQEQDTTKTEEARQIIKTYQDVLRRYESARFEYAICLYVTESLYLHLCDTMKATDIRLILKKEGIDPRRKLHKELMNAVKSETLGGKAIHTNYLFEAMSAARGKLVTSYKRIQSYNAQAEAVAKELDTDPLSYYQLPIENIKQRLALFNELTLNEKRTIQESTLSETTKGKMLNDLEKLYPEINYEKLDVTKPQRERLEKLFHEKGPDVINTPLPDEILGAFHDD